MSFSRRRTCSLCQMRDAVAVFANPANITFITEKDKLSLYQFGTKTAKHYFCLQCGIYTYHLCSSSPNEFGVNVACLEGISPFAFEEVLVYDGANHHPSDRQTGSRIDRTFHYEKK